MRFRRLLLSISSASAVVAGLGVWALTAWADSGDGAPRVTSPDERPPAAPGAPNGDAPGEKSSLPFTPVVERFPNGLTLVTAKTDAPGIVAYYTLVRVGSRDEVEPGHSGFAHLFEHMMFRGTENISEEEYELKIQSFGADNNAYTTQDFTLYTVTAPAVALPEIVALEADRFQRLKYSEEQFRTETGAVLGEYNKSASNPFLKMWEGLSELAFRRHTYGHTTLGYLRDIKAMPERYRYSLRFFDRFYTPDNTVIIVAGDVDHAELSEMVSKHYGEWRGRRARTRPKTEPKPKAGANRHIAWEGLTPPKILMGYRTPAFLADHAKPDDALRDSAALRVVHGLAFGEASRLHRKLVVDEQTLLELSSWNDHQSLDPHLFVVSADLKDGVAFDDIVSEIQAELDRMASGAAPASRIEDVKSHVRYSLLMGLETPSDVADLVGSFLAVGADVKTLSAYLDALSEVTAEDVARVAREYLTEDRRYVVTLAQGEAPGEKKAAGGEGAVR